MANSFSLSLGRRRSKLFYILSLMRPANVLTSATNILAGVAIAGFISSSTFIDIPHLSEQWTNNFILLVMSGCALYAGGVVLNDVFDYNLDKIERPERALPSGKVSLREAALLGIFFLLVGIAAAFRVNYISGIISLLTSLCAVLYNYKSKHYKLFGPFNMGLCRALNLCMGISIIPASLMSQWMYAIIPLFYILAITLISHGEVKGGNLSSLKAALGLYLGLLLTIVYIQSASWPFVLVWAIVILPPLIRALKTKEAKEQRNAVKAGVLAVILMDASLASGFAAIYYSLLIVSLLPISIFLGRKFSIT